MNEALQQAPQHLEPVAPGERIAPLDVLRGVALLGILLMNIRFFSMIGAAYDNPTAYGDLHGANYLVWYATALLADTKFMAIFSMLFGAGMVLMAQRQEKAGRAPWRVHLRRMFVLLLFGLAHAYLLWAGDILYTYALCGLVVFWLRRLRPALQIVLGLAVLGVGSLLPVAFSPYVATWSEEDRRELRQSYHPPPEQVEEEVRAYKGNWRQQFEKRRGTAWWLETVEFGVFLFWRAAGLMLIGMALFRLRVLDASRPAGFYLALITAGVLVGLPVIAWGLHTNEASGWDAIYTYFVGMQYNYWGSLPLALGWVGLVMLVCQSPQLRPMTRPLAAVGRTALSNYLLQTVLCTTIFYGHGLGLFGKVERVGQMRVVVGVWAVQLVVSPLWLRYFRFGPAEWLWRSLTYWRRQPMRLRPAGKAGVPYTEEKDHASL
jgi:uncharacterized protein